jgi:hypothetical protein
MPVAVSKVNDEADAKPDTSDNPHQRTQLQHHPDANQS